MYAYIHALHCIALHCTTPHCTTLHYTTLHWITLYYIALDYTTLHYLALPFIIHTYTQNMPCTYVHTYQQSKYKTTPNIKNNMSWFLILNPLGLGCLVQSGVCILACPFGTYIIWVGIRDSTPPPMPGILRWRSQHFATIDPSKKPSSCRSQTGSRSQWNAQNSWANGNIYVNSIRHFTLFSLVIFLIVCVLFFLMLRIELQMEVVGEIGVARVRGAGGRSWPDNQTYIHMYFFSVT